MRPFVLFEVRKTLRSERDTGVQVMVPPNLLGFFFGFGVGEAWNEYCEGADGFSSLLI
jgi:hypothetical protein